MISITGSDDNTLAKEATVNLNVHVSREACPLNLAPTSSTTATLAMGDALAVACLDAKGFGPEDFARSHPDDVFLPMSGMSCAAERPHRSFELMRQ